jgi:hypothetical protein
MDGIAGLLRFNKTGGPLVPDTYTVTLRSALDGFKDRNGALIDGDGDGTPGGDFIVTFVAEPLPAQVLSLPDVVRGPGQPIDIPATSVSLPIRISDGAGVNKVEVTLRYDSSVFEPATYSLAPDVFGGLGLQFTPEWTRFTLTLSSPLPAGPVDLIHVNATIPEDAVYGETSTLYLEDPGVNDVPLGEADSATLVVAYFGDTTGNRGYSAADATRILRVATGLDTGFAAYRFVDPVVVADISGNGGLGSLDATRLLQEVVGIDQPTTPPLPPAPGSTSLTNTFAPTPLTTEPSSSELSPLTLETSANFRVEKPSRRFWEWVVIEEE